MSVVKIGLFKWISQPLNNVWSKMMTPDERH